MTMTGLDVFDATVHKTHERLNEIANELGAGNRHDAYGALRAAIHALRDRLTVEEAVHFGAQLPMLIRGVYYEGWSPAGKPLKRHKDEFLDGIRAALRGRTHTDPEAIARAVFAVIARHVTAGEVADVKNILPKELRALWP